MASTGAKRRADAEARKASALPLVASGLPYAEVAEAVGVSARTVTRWVAEDERFREAVSVREEAGRRAVSESGDVIERIMRKALGRLEALVESEDERIALDAVKTAADRFGYPTVSESKAQIEASGAGVGLVVAMTAEDRDAWARRKGGE